MADGPRALRSGEWDQLDRLVSTVFRPEMFHDYPQLFNEGNRENLRVVAEDGNVVCHVGMTERHASLAGCGIDVACIGAVSTLDEYRGRGFASQAFQDACSKAAGDGIDVMLISGGRGLYTRVGCREVGRDAVFTITREALASFRDALDNDALGTGREARYAVEQVSAQQIDGLRVLYQREAVRFLRPLEDWEMAFDCGIVMNTASDFWGLSTGGTLLAYIVVHQPDKVRRRGPDAPTTLRVAEFAGERTAVVAALPRLLEHYGTDRLTIHVQGTDPALHAYLAGPPAAGGPAPGERESGTGGLNSQPASASGTLRVINFPQLMERCRPLLAERLGTKGAAELAFEADAAPGSAEGGFTIRRGAERLRLPDLGALATYVFGAAEGRVPGAEPVAPSAGAPRTAGASLDADLSQALPLPTLWYGLNYV